jgi:FkbM family methyltransferase
VLDIGAAAGYYTLLAASLVGSGGSIVACEPFPGNRRFLQAHVRRNGLGNVRVLSCAVADRNGTANFGGGTGSGTSRLQADGAIEVSVRRLDDLAAEHDLAPHHVKIDVEGAELDVLRGGEQTFREHQPTIFLSTHGPDVHRACCELLDAWGYRLQPIVGSSVAEATELLCHPKARA